MRCKNCGWENPAGVTKCEKCGNPLVDSTPYEPQGTHHPSYARNDSALMGTVREDMVFGLNSGSASSVGNSSESVCINCGYELAAGMKVCPACGTPVNKKPIAQPETPKGDTHKLHEQAAVHCVKCGAELQPGARFCPQCGHSLRAGTVGVWENPQQEEFCTLKPIAWAKEEIDYNPMTYSGEVIVLNRENTEPNNQTITSKEQAELTHENGVWYIEDRSEKKSTMLRVSRKMKLQSGDVIALGNRLFEFKD